MATTDANGAINFANEKFCKISGYTNEELIGQNHRILNSGFHSKEFFRELYATIANGKLWRNEIRNKAKDGSLYWVDTTIVPFLNEQGKPFQYVSIRIDITDRKIAQAQLEAVNKELESGAASLKNANLIAEEAVKSKQQFLSNMSHEIRTPMNAIIGFTKVVLKTELTAKQKEYLTAIKVSGDAMILLINDILDLAKVDSGKMTFLQAPFKLASSLSAMLHLFETKMQEKNLELVVEYDSRIPEVLLGDPARLHQIILNLVSNSVKFTKEGKIIVSVCLIKEDEESVVVEFAIKDTGIGIAQNKLEKVFENFQQASNVTSRLYGGTGLGLAIVKQLVEAQGGKVVVMSKMDEGSTFSFALKFKKTDAEAEPELELTKIDREIKNIKVLVVEDITLNQLLMKTLLDDFGFERDIAENGLIAIEKLKSKDYDIILMDLQMPEMNGFEATEYIRNTMKSEIPIIALTADVTTIDLEKCKAVGMNDYVAKPVDEKALYSKIISLVSKAVAVSVYDCAEFENQNSENLKVIDLTFLKIRTKGNANLMAQMIAAYLEQTPPLLKAMKQSYAEKDWSLLKAVAHKMIPSFSIMGIEKEYENRTRKIQEGASLQQDSAELSLLVSDVINICEKACEKLRAELEELNTNSGV